MKFMELEPFGLEFKNVISGPAPIGRMLNYIKKIGDDELFYDGVRRTTGGNVADAWCVDFMVGLGLVRIDSEIVDNKYPLVLTENGERVYGSLPDLSMPFDETSNVQEVIKQLDANYETVRVAFENVFRKSVPYKNLSIFLKDKKYWFKSGEFYWDYYNELFDDYGISGTRSEDTARNRIPSVVQCCYFVGFAESGNVGGVRGIFFIRDKFDFEKENSVSGAELNEQTDEDRILIKKYDHNRLVSGAPGTGKSFQLYLDSKPFKKNMERVTFYPRYSYGQFVGMYKPIDPAVEGKTIAYRYVPGPFMRIYAKAVRSFYVNKDGQAYLLLIEEINRAKSAAVFGDVFQLLDREGGESIYPIATSEDARDYLARELFGKNNYRSCNDEEKELCAEMKLPPNMYVWATMNSADQGVEVLDTAFKRRWEYDYFGINDVAEKVADYRIPVGTGSNQHIVLWDELRRGINEVLIEQCHVQEDKLLGPFFMSKGVLETAVKSQELKNEFVKKFKNKVLLYLFTDVAVGCLPKLFNGCDNTSTYSHICDLFDTDAERIFGFTLEVREGNE